jgi:hypothetical protein
MITISSPIYVNLKNKKYALNLNVYRNLNYHVLNDLKKEYSKIIKPKLKNIKFESPIILSFVLHFGRRSRVDRDNICSIVSKFFLDCLVNENCLEDDSDRYILKSCFSSGEIDAKNPRCDITISTH